MEELARVELELDAREDEDVLEALEVDDELEALELEVEVTPDVDPEQVKTAGPGIV